jgi:hypothetical protein
MRAERAAAHPCPYLDDLDQRTQSEPLSPDSPSICGSWLLASRAYSIRGGLLMAIIRCRYQELDLAECHAVATAVCHCAAASAHCRQTGRRRFGTLPADWAPTLRNRWFADSAQEGAGFELSVPRQMDLCKHRKSPRIATPGAQIGGELMKMDPTASLAYPASVRGGRPAVGKPGAS